MKRSSIIVSTAICLILIDIAFSSVGQAIAQQTELQNSNGLFADVNGIRMYYETYGEGEPLVLLHGFTGTGASHWQPYVDDFATQYRLIIPDLRGHGRSTNPTDEFTHRQAALDVFALLDDLNIDRFRGMGTSTGGMTLIHMATQQPERAEAIVLIGATTHFTKQAREVMREWKVESITEQEWEEQRKKHRNGDDQIRKLIRQFNGFKDSYDDMNFTPPYLSTIKARTFIVHGDRDSFFPVQIPIEMYRNIPNSYLWIIPNGGHVPISGKNQATFTEKSLEFLKGDWENGSEPR